MNSTAEKSEISPKLNEIHNETSVETPIDVYKATFTKTSSKEFYKDTSKATPPKELEPLYKIQKSSFYSPKDQKLIASIPSSGKKVSPKENDELVFLPSLPPSIPHNPIKGPRRRRYLLKEKNIKLTESNESPEDKELKSKKETVWRIAIGNKVLQRKGRSSDSGLYTHSRELYHSPIKKWSLEKQISSLPKFGSSYLSDDEINTQQVETTNPFSTNDSLIQDSSNDASNQNVDNQYSPLTKNNFSEPLSLSSSNLYISTKKYVSPSNKDSNNINSIHTSNFGSLQIVQNKSNYTKIPMKNASRDNLQKELQTYGSNNPQKIKSNIELSASRLHDESDSYTFSDSNQRFNEMMKREFKSSPGRRMSNTEGILFRGNVSINSLHSMEDSKNREKKKMTKGKVSIRMPMSHSKLLNLSVSRSPLSPRAQITPRSVSPTSYYSPKSPSNYQSNQHNLYGQYIQQNQSSTDIASSGLSSKSIKELDTLYETSSSIIKQINVSHTSNDSVNPKLRQSQGPFSQQEILKEAANNMDTNDTNDTNDTMDSVDINNKINLRDNINTNNISDTKEGNTSSMHNIVHNLDFNIQEDSKFEASLKVISSSFDLSPSHRSRNGLNNSVVSSILDFSPDSPINSRPTSVERSRLRIIKSHRLKSKNSSPYPKSHSRPSTTTSSTSFNSYPVNKRTFPVDTTEKEIEEKSDYISILSPMLSPKQDTESLVMRVLKSQLNGTQAELELYPSRVERLKKSIERRFQPRKRQLAIPSRKNNLSIELEG